MNLKSFGCSFIYGSELSDEIPNNTHRHHSKLTWPGQLAQHLNYDYLCYARPGAGNLQIAEQVLTHIATNKKTALFQRFTFRSSGQTDHTDEYQVGVRHTLSTKLSIYNDVHG